MTHVWHTMAQMNWRTAASQATRSTPSPSRHCCGVAVNGSAPPSIKAHCGLNEANCRLSPALHSPVGDAAATHAGCGAWLDVGAAEAATVVAAAVVGAAEVGAAVVEAAAVVGAAVVGAAVVGAAVGGASVVGAAVVGASVVGASVVGAAVVTASVVALVVVVGAGASVVGASVVGTGVVAAVLAEKKKKNKIKTDVCVQIKV